MPSAVVTVQELVPAATGLAKNPLAQTHLDDLFKIVVSPVSQGVQASAAPVENSLMPQVLHSESPALL